MKVSVEQLKSRRKEIIQCITSFERELNIIKPDMIHLATFVSPKKKQKWSVYNLWKAFHHLDAFLHSVDVKQLRPSEVGEKTESNPLSYDSIMLYIIMQRNDVSYHKADTLHSMREKINEHLNKPSSPVPVPSVLVPSVLVRSSPVPSVPDDFDFDDGIQKIINSIKTQNNETVWKITELLQEDSHFNFDDCDKEELKKIASSVKSHGTIYSSCLSNAEAVIYGIRFFSVDFSESSHPILELKRFCQTKMEGKKFKPVSNAWKDKYLLNRGWYNTEKQYNPKLQSYYSQKSSEKLISYNGGRDDDTLDFFTRYEDDNTFYAGVPPFTGGAYISFFENIDLDPEHSKIITYGNLKQRDFIYLTPKELKEYFENQKDFSDFRDRNVEISFHAIRKLRNICKDNRNEEDYSALLERIGFFFETGKPNFPYLKELFTQYLIYSDDLERYFRKFHETCKPPSDISFSQDLKNVLQNLPLLTYNGTRYFRLKKKLVETVNDDDELRSSIVYYYETMTNGKFSSSLKEDEKKKTKEVKEKKKAKEEVVFEERGEGEIEKLEKMMGF